MHHRINTLPLKQKIILCITAYASGILLAWAIDWY
ncbi:hypothetical protein PMI31_05938 [Pseudomonas sp. GM55]|jgi:hypothetical protein|nr:hypothetical protein PMI31_05938 [Pseudomonas sp. GM55]